MGIDVVDALLCVSIVLSFVCYVLIFNKARTIDRLDIEDKIFVIVYFLAATVPILNVIGLAVYIIHFMHTKSKQIKNIPPSLIKLVRTFINNKDYEYTDGPAIKNNTLEIRVTKDYIVFKNKHYTTDLFAHDLKRIECEKAESATEQLLDAYIKTRKGV